MHVSFVTLFPEFFDGPMGCAIPSRAVASGALTWDTVNPRDFARDRHRSVDDTPYGGGAGMLMRPEPLADAIAAARRRRPGALTLLLSPQGRRLDQEQVAALAREPALILVSGRYEGVDERVIERCVDAEVSIGDFVLSGGEPAALCLADAVVRLLPGVLGNADSVVEESFSTPLLEFPQFTRPAEFDGLAVPPVLRSGDHGRVARWRRKASLLRTEARRPDLATAEITRKDRKLLEDSRLDVPAWTVAPRHLKCAVDDASQSCILRRPDAPGFSRTKRD